MTQPTEQPAECTELDQLVEPSDNSGDPDLAPLSQHPGPFLDDTGAGEQVTT